MQNSKIRPRRDSDVDKPWAKSVLVVAHPDDEILWFSSIVDKVDAVILCFMGNPRVPERRGARLRVLDDYPLGNVTTLDIDTSGASSAVNWNTAIESNVGLKIENSASQKAYQKTYQQIVDELRSRLGGYANVYTHNPWGEYGHADHVQVHRAANSLSTELGFQVLFGNYVSPKSMQLALPYLCKAGYPESVTLSTNVKLAHRVRDLYIRENCWTVPGDFSWAKFESFNSNILETDGGGSVEKSYLFPLNFIPWRYRKPGPKNLSQRASRKLMKFRKRTLGVLKST
jgi:hypothetical protein